MRRALVPLTVLAVAALVVTWLVEPNLIIGLRSPRALAWVGGLGLLCAALGLVVHRLTRRVGAALAAAALPGLVATGLFVVRPILDPRELNEALPTTGALTTATSSDSLFDPAAPAPAAPAAAMLAASGPAKAAPAKPAPAKPAPAKPAPAKPAPARSTSAAPAAAAPTRIAAGELRGLAGHDASGTVSTYRLADGSHVVRFEDVDIGGTPSPHVYLVRGSDQRGKRGGVHLGELKAEKGSFNYTLPAGFAPEDFTVLVWCEQFAVEIANATQA